MQNTIAGLAVVAGGLLHGSFAAPMKSIEKRWKWENIWLVYSVFALLVFPPLLALATVPSLAGVYLSTPISVTLLVAVFGLGWGTGSVLFGQAISRVGMGLGFAVILGITSTLGSLLPLVVQDPRALWTAKGATLLAGLAIAVCGIVICSAAGSQRDKESRRAAVPATGGKFITGLLISVASGLLSPMLNFGFVFGAPLQDAARAAGASASLASNAIWAPALAAGFLVNGGYAIYLLNRNKSWGAFSGGKVADWLGGCVMGLLWYGGMSIYGMGAADMGRMGAVIGWPVFMSTVIVTANVLGFLTGEWRYAGPRARAMEWIGIVFLIGAIVVVSRAL